MANMFLTKTNRRNVYVTGPGFAEAVVRAADAAASTATAETAVYVLGATNSLSGGSFRFVRVTYIPSAALTADNTNNAVITVIVRRAAALSTPITVATITTNVASGNWVAWTNKDLTLSATLANRLILPGDVLSYSVTKGGTGVVIPAGSLQLEGVAT